MLAPELRDLAMCFLDNHRVARVSEPLEPGYLLRNAKRRDPFYLELRVQKDAKLSEGYSSGMGVSIARHLKELVDNKRIAFDHITGVPRGGDPFAEGLASRFGMAAFFLKKDLNTNDEIVGITANPPPEGSLVLPVENVAVTGKATEKAVRFLFGRRYRVTHVLAAINRGSGAAERLHAIGVELVSLMEMVDMLDFYLEEKVVLREPALQSIANAEQDRLECIRQLNQGLSG